MSTHQDLILDQFTKQAIPFATAPGIKDEEALKLVVESTGARPNDTVLDVACGPGLVVGAFAHVVRHATGIDLTPAMIEHARMLQQTKGLTNVSWQVGDVQPLPYADASFSIVTSRYAFHHFLDPGAVLAEMKRVCTPGGTVAVIDVTASPDPEKAAAYNRMEKLRDPSHVRGLTLVELEALFERAAFSTPRKKFYRVEFDLEDTLQRSFPNPGDADTIRQIFLHTLENDGLGMNARRTGNRIRYDYPIAVLVAEKR
ncbi:MAG: methyltransferase domain-containing protein [Deltaproteobacteria bacterium]|nr:methyltransferase domain-containing protein [Deltaproteobacteria bacterium]